jgi:hypothetical protein
MWRIALIIALFLYFLGIGTANVFAEVNPDDIQKPSVCSGIADSARQGACMSCMSDGSDGLKVWTAIGCIETTNPVEFFKSMLMLGVGMAGGIAFLLILFGGLQIMTSAGNPEQLNAGRELVSASITGLLVIIFSLFILRFIGMDLIGIPGFGGQ